MTLYSLIYSGFGPRQSSQLDNLIGKSEIQSLIALVLCCLDVVLSLFWRPRVPNLISPVVYISVERVYRQVHKDISDRYSN
jgi:hypothetical protein